VGIPIFLAQDGLLDYTIPWKEKKIQIEVTGS